jgi:hypothetical protein
VEEPQKEEKDLGRLSGLPFYRLKLFLDQGHAVPQKLDFHFRGRVKQDMCLFFMEDAGRNRKYRDPGEKNCRREGG